MSVRRIRNRRVRNFGGVILAGGLVVGAASASGQTAAAGQTSTTLPDAQIESNVLKALATAPDLATQNIQTATVYGTVTLNGNVRTEAMRNQAENLVAHAKGVKKVIDEMTLGDKPAAATADETAQDQGAQAEQLGSPQANQPVLQSDGTYAPAPDGTGAAQNSEQAQGSADGAPAAGGNPPPPPPPGDDNGRAPLAPNDVQTPEGRPIPGGQRAGIPVRIPAGAILRVRINRGLLSNRIQPGAGFDGTVLTDVVAGGAVAIPRGANVTGTVIFAKKAGVFKGQGELSLQLDSLTLGGTVYKLPTQIWASNGPDKTPHTVNNAVGLGAVGALFGAFAGGGVGAAVGAGVGAGAGLAGSAASPRGQVVIPPESVLTFRTAAPVVVRTVSEQEMQRLSYAAGPQRPAGPPRVRYYSPYYGYYYGPPVY